MSNTTRFNNVRTLQFHSCSIWMMIIQLFGLQPVYVFKRKFLTTTVVYSLISYSFCRPVRRNTFAWCILSWTPLLHWFLWQPTNQHAIRGMTCDIYRGVVSLWIYWWKIKILNRTHDTKSSATPTSRYCYLDHKSEYETLSKINHFSHCIFIMNSCAKSTLKIKIPKHPQKPQMQLVQCLWRANQLSHRLNDNEYEDFAKCEWICANKS